MLWKVGLKEQRERKNKSKVTQELVKKKRRGKYSRITNKKRNESLTQMKKEGKQQGERIGETGRDKVI